MDLVLGLCDDLLFDRVWASLLPLHAFTNIPSSYYQAFNSSTSPRLSSSLSAGSSWSNLISRVHLPHPRIAQNLSLPSGDMSFVSAWPRDYVPRQIISLSVITLIGVHLLYFIFAGLSYKLIFNHDMMRHPRFLKNQVRLEIQTSLKAFPMMTLLTLPWFQAEVMGYSMLYDDVHKYGWGYLFFSILWYLVFTDYCIYWIHRWLHVPRIYKHLHKPHHKWIVPTPFASHAFHPVDGYLQSVPYHLFIFLFPLQRKLYLGLFVAVNFWSIFIHDSDMVTGHPLENIINGPAHHTQHHIYFTVNYGQYFTWADRAGGSYRHPAKEDDPMNEVNQLEVAKVKQDKSD